MLKLLYEQADFPVFQNRMYESAQEAIDCPKGDIRLVEDTETGLVYNAAFRPELMSYDGSYQNEQGVSEHFRRHLETVADIVDQHIGRERLVEVGCGKGFFLELLLERGFDVTGFDATYEGSNPRVRRQYYGPGVIDRAEGLVLRHVLEHIQDPFAFLELLRDANGGSGKIYIEVPCLDWICEHKAWFDIFYEHVNYFRLADFQRMFGEIVDCGRLFGGQYLYVVAELSSVRQPGYDPADAARFPADFMQQIDAPIIGGGDHSVVWGGASKGVIFTLLKSRAGFAIDVVIDINPAKQGKYLAATGIQVSSPEQALPRLPSGSTVFVMNSNYLDEIKRMSNNAYNYIGIDMSDFSREVAERVAAVPTNKELQAASKNFLLSTIAARYSYNFAWQGRPIIQYPQDMIAMQELIWQVRPDLIIETGIAHGGSLIFSAAMLAQLDLCDAIEAGATIDPRVSQRKVIGIDIDIRAHNRIAIEAHPMASRIQMIQGSSIAPEIVAKVHAAAAGFKRILVCLDSNHTHDHVLAELEAYAPLTSVDSYCVVFDTVVEDMPKEMSFDRPWGPGNNPKTAVWKYLESHKEFEIDKSIQNKLLVTVAQDGYLKRRST
jgi:cephalosporin hydroxylase/SAM-dependent methyltransferase